MEGPFVERLSEAIVGNVLEVLQPARVDMLSRVEGRAAP